MNYRHAYHAGNFADCFKHALLVALLEAFARKPAPYFVLDTHAGAGGYDLRAEPARRTAEASAGILRLCQSTAPALARYLALVSGAQNTPAAEPGIPAEVTLYPGSPALIRATLREGDRLACCELHPEDARSLRRRFHHDTQVEVHDRSGWEALGALLPPREKRGLVFIDPPFEAPDEFATLVTGLQRGHGRFRHGVFAAWYPIKHMASVREFHAMLATSAIRDMIAVELRLRDPTNPDTLNGCGLVVINPPYQFPDQATAIAQAVLDGLGSKELGAGISVTRLADE